MAAHDKILQLDPPQRRKWVKFGDWDEEALEFRQITSMSTSNPSISSSVSSVTFSSNSEIASSISSDSLDYQTMLRRQSVGQEEAPAKPHIQFNASFGGTSPSGEPAGLRSSWLIPNHHKPLRKQMSDNDLLPPSYLSASVDEKMLKYSAFAELEENKEQSMGWSRELVEDMMPAQVETLTGRRAAMWSGSPDRSFVRNFP